MGQVWFGTKLNFKGLPMFVLNQKIKPQPINLVLYKISVKAGSIIQARSTFYMGMKQRNQFKYHVITF